MNNIIETTHVYDQNDRMHSLSCLSNEICNYVQLFSMT